jgi:hypothetical protein
MVDLADDFFHIILRVSVDESLIIGPRMLIIHNIPNLLLPHKPINRPKFIIIARICVLPFTFLHECDLLIAYYALDAVHNPEIMVAWSHPLVLTDLADLSEVIGDFTIVFQVVGGEELEPISDQFTALLRCDEVAFIGEMPSTFGVGFLIDLPFESCGLSAEPC